MEPLNQDSPPRLSRPKCTTRPPKNYVQGQEIGNEQRRTRPQQGKRVEPKAQPDVAMLDNTMTKSNNLDVSNLVREIAKLRREIRLQDELHKEELQKAKAEFGAALTEVRHELQNLTDRPPTPQCHSEACAQNSHDEILRKIQSLREAIGPCVPTGSPSYADVTHTPPLSHPSNIQTLSMLNTNPTTLTNTLYCTIDTLKLAETENKKMSAGSIQAAVKTEIQVTKDHSHWRCHTITVDPKNTNQIRIACRNKAEHQLV